MIAVTGTPRLASRAQFSDILAAVIVSSTYGCSAQYETEKSGILTSSAKPFRGLRPYLAYALNAGEIEAGLSVFASVPSLAAEAPSNWSVTCASEIAKTAGMEKPREASLQYPCLRVLTTDLAPPDLR